MDSNFLLSIIPFVRYGVLLCCSAWVLEEFVWSYADNKEKYSAPNRQFRGFQEAIDAADEVAATMPAPPEVSPLLNGCVISVFMPYSAYTR